MIATDFIAAYSTPVVLSSLGTALLPSVIMAQAALETGWGASVVGNNMFGIKASGATSPYWKGNSVSADTEEVIGGETGTYNLAFRQYANVQDSISDHTYFLRQNSRYASVFTAKTPENQCNALQAAGYATDPNYASKLISIINKYGLASLDKKKS
jgi:flagellum-specific peptidoglycan hydrolase FlgJ